MNGALSVCEKRVQLINSCWLLRSYNKRVVWEAQRDARATIRRFNARLSAKGNSWFWPKIAAALTSKHHWLVINCDSCGTGFAALRKSTSDNGRSCGVPTICSL
jgi:hypothetical protein